MKRRTIFFLTIVVVVAAIFVIPPILRILVVNPLTLSMKPDDVAVLKQVSASNPNTGGAITLLAVTEEKGVGLQARPVDPATLSALPGFAPINFGHHYTYASSPDRQTLAVIIWPSGSDNAGGVLHLIDLDTWTDALTNLQLDSYVNELTFSADGKTLFWTAPTVYDPAHGMPRDYQLYRYDLNSRQLSAIVRFPSSFSPWSQRLASGKIAIFGIPTGPDNLAEDIPHLLIIDPTRNRIAADVRLDSVKAGQFREQAMNVTPSTQEGSWQYVSYSPGLAWDLESNMLYVIHADDDKVIVVDLAEGTVVQRARIQMPQSFLEWVSNSLAPVAEAKGGPWLGIRVILSRNGERLYVLNEKTGMDLPKTTDLRVIATDEMREISRLDDLLTDFALTPDGKSLLIVKGEIVRSNGFDMVVNRDVYILDAESLKERVHLRVDQVDQLAFDGFSPDGRYAYLRGSSSQWVEESGWRNWRVTWQLLDLASYRLISAGESRSSYAVLLHLVP